MKALVTKLSTHTRAAALAILGITAGLVFAATPAQSGQNMVDVCHKGTVLSVAGPAVAGHLRHGDTVMDIDPGECDIPLPPPIPE